jgi:Zn-dependent M28 family amino/carboxypeptidase
MAETAEEKGLLGSKYFVAHPTVPFDRIVADINLDMFLPLYPLKVIEVQGVTESSLGDRVREAAKQQGVEVQTDREPEQNRFIRSDQYSFIRRGIPSLAFKFGYEFGSPEEKIRRDWVRDVYHKPNDDLKQPVDVEGAANFDRVILGCCGAWRTIPRARDGTTTASSSDLPADSRSDLVRVESSIRSAPVAVSHDEWPARTRARAAGRSTRPDGARQSASRPGGRWP